MFIGLLFSFLIVSQQDIWNLWGVERPMIFSWEIKSMWSMINHKTKWACTLLYWMMDEEKGPWGHYGSDLKERKPFESFLCRISLEGVFQEHIPHKFIWRSGWWVDHQPFPTC